MITFNFHKAIRRLLFIILIYLIRLSFLKNSFDLSQTLITAFGLFISTIIIGAIVEIINIPFRIWWYQWPFPSIELMGLPIIMIAFGWLPWVLAMF